MCVGNFIESADRYMKGGSNMSVITVNHVTFYYEGSAESVFEDVSFQLDTDWKLGFIGRNGKGKTTFLKLLMGAYEYRGTISASTIFDYFPFEVLHPEHTTLQVVEETAPDVEFWTVCRELNELQIAEDIWDRPFYSLSYGERTKVLLAVLFARENHFLLIDEPTNHLDMETREAVSRYLNSKKGFILVSHDRNFLDGCIDHVLSLNRSNIEVVQGDFSSFWENKKRRDAFELAENERLKKDIRRLSETAKKAGKWADEVESTKIGEKSEKYEKCIDTRAYVGEKSRRMQQRRKNLERRKNREIEEKEGLLHNIEEVAELQLRPLRFHKEVLAQIKELSLYYPGQGDAAADGMHRIFAPVSFQVRNGDRIVLQGRNGSGKSSVIKYLLGEDITATGLVTTQSGLKISYVAQDADNLCGTLRDYIREHQLEERLMKQFLRKMDFEREQFEKRLEEYSAGQKKKVLLAKSLCEQAHLYIWDEPLNYIDIFSRMQLEELILKYAPTMILVEHDKSFVERVATKVVKMV